ncbi:ABC transporter substrate-binding protein [Alloyangia pacifica]|uniref:ABC transporter substrate-binding protein n=1 Tax=Alloyangia pacifica TaxID=311180 RepID=UPI001CFE6340|nr:ABC transporter substrate-binding protein [Alloyangia pacifica]
MSLLVALVMSLGTVSARAEIRVTDLAGREVVLEQPAKRIVLGEGRHLAVLGMLQADPVALLAGWRQDKGLDPATYDAYLAKFPALADVTPVGAGNRLLSVESTIALMPDLVLLSLMDARDPQMEMPLRQLEAAGIPVAFVDFFTAPLENTLPSLKLIGELTGAEDKAGEFAEFYNDHLDAVRNSLKAAQPAPPRVFIHVHAAPTNCCATVGPGVFDEFVEAAGGYNIGRDSVPGVMGNVGLENLLASDPDVYLATGGAHMKARGGLVLGAGIDTETAEQSFADLLETPGFADLRAVQEGRAIGIWHLFNDFPAHIALIEALAKRIHPDLFPDLDPMATMAEFEERFSPVEMTGSYWISAE